MKVIEKVARSLDFLYFMTCTLFQSYLESGFLIIFGEIFVDLRVRLVYTIVILPILVDYLVIYAKAILSPPFYGF